MRGQILRNAILGLLFTAACALGRAQSTESTESTQSLPDLVVHAKPSVALVGVWGLLDSPRFGFRGTGFVVGDGHQLITNAHVLPPPEEARDDRHLAIQIYGADKQWSERQATVIEVDAAHDLALLSFEGAAAPVLQLAADGVAREGSEIAFMGFPIGGALGYSQVTHHGYISAITPIALPTMNGRGLNDRLITQIRQGSFAVFQLDATAYPGNSGGPVFDVASGAIVGVINMVFVKGAHESALTAPSGISYAIPVEYVRALVAKWQH